MALLWALNRSSLMKRMVCNEFEWFLCVRVMIYAISFRHSLFYTVLMVHGLECASLTRSWRGSPLRSDLWLCCVGWLKYVFCISENDGFAWRTALCCSQMVKPAAESNWKCVKYGSWFALIGIIDNATPYSDCAIVSYIIYEPIDGL